MSSLKVVFAMAAISFVSFAYAQDSSAPSPGSPDEDLLNRIIMAHGVLAAAAWVIFFPLGAILVRVLNKAAFHVHMYIQLFAALVFTAGWALGAWIATTTDQWVTPNGHPIIGTVVFGLMIIQPFLGAFHHQLWKKNGQHTAWAWAHVWIGRTLITLAIINGGLGLQLSDNTYEGEIAYGVIAGSVWCVYVLAMVITMLRPKGDAVVGGEMGKKVTGDVHHAGASPTAIRDEEVISIASTAIGRHPNGSAVKETVDTTPPNASTAAFGHVTVGGIEKVNGSAI